MICNRFAMTSPLMLVIPVMFCSCLARLVTIPAATGSMVATNTAGVRPADSLAGSTDGVPEATSTSKPATHELRCDIGDLRRTFCQAVLDHEFFFFNNAPFAHSLAKGINERRRWR